DAVGIDERQHALDADVARNRRRADGAAPKARSLFADEDDDLERPPRLHAGGVERLERAHGAGHAERPVELAARRHRVEVRAGHDHRLLRIPGGAVARAPAAAQVAHLVVPHVEPGGAHAFGDEGARLGVLARQRPPRDAAVAAEADLAEVRQIGEQPLLVDSNGCSVFRTAVRNGHRIWTRPAARRPVPPPGPLILAISPATLAASVMKILACSDSGAPTTT